MAAINLREIPYEVIELVPESVARENLVLPLAGDDQHLSIAYSYDLLDWEVSELRDKLRFILYRSIELIAFRREELQDAIDWHFRYGTIETCGGTRLRIEFRCPRQWSQLVPTDDATVRYCTECQEPVYLCTTDEELVAHAQANHCTARQNEGFGEHVVQEFCSYALGAYEQPPDPSDPPLPPRIEVPADPPLPPRIEVPAASSRLLNQLRSLFRPVK